MRTERGQVFQPFLLCCFTVIAITTNTMETKAEMCVYVFSCYLREGTYRTQTDILKDIYVQNEKPQD